MKVVCSYCKVTLKPCEDGCDNVSHGACHACAVLAGDGLSVEEIKEIIKTKDKDWVSNCCQYPAYGEFDRIANLGRCNRCMKGCLMVEEWDT